jgi:hypothetical protein
VIFSVVLVLPAPNYFSIFSQEDNIMQQKNRVLPIGHVWDVLEKVRDHFGDTLHIFTFGIPARPKEDRANMESEDPRRGTAVIDILGREG